MAAVRGGFSFVLLFCCLKAIHGDVLRKYSVNCQNEKCQYKEGLDVDSTAFGVYQDTLDTTGWGILNITSGRAGTEVENNDIMFAAGYLEAILTYDRIFQHYENVNDYFKGKFGNNTKTEKRVKEFFVSQDFWMRDMIKNNYNDPYWKHVGYIVAQYDGLIKGYGDIASDDTKLPLYAFQMLNGVGDMLDLVTALSDSKPDFDKMSKDEALEFIAKSGHCSALIKVLGAYEDIFMSHSSWFIYQATMRIYKHYDFNINDPSGFTATRQMSFSSYPGFLESLDDFYLMDSGLVMLQTTNNVFNTSLYDQVTSQSLLAWHRVRLANMMAHSGEEWAQIFGKFNSGTYNNQYMIIDLKLIEIGRNIYDNALWVVEQIPGLVASADNTRILRTGYWPSYNVPYFEEVYNKSGYPDFVKKHGTDFSYQLAPRAKIFRRDEGKVVDMDSMKKIMRYNDYTEDPYSEGDSCNAICCCGDLRNNSPGPFGCYDTKVANYSMALQRTADIINGPTLGTGLSPFEWTSTYKQSHVGLPKKYDFPFLQVKPLDPPNV